MVPFIRPQLHSHPNRLSWEKGNFPPLYLIFLNGEEIQINSQPLGKWYNTSI